MTHICVTKQHHHQLRQQYASSVTSDYVYALAQDFSNTSVLAPHVKF